MPWQSLFLAYGAAISAEVVPLTPLGVSVVEVAVQPGRADRGEGRAAAIALAAVLVYRLINFWLVMTIGWAVVAVHGLSRCASPDPAQAAVGGDHGDTSRANGPGVA